MESTSRATLPTIRRLRKRVAKGVNERLGCGCEKNAATTESPGQRKGYRNPGGGTLGHEETEQKARELATFAAGCFWGVEESFRNIDGVTDVTVGYTGGSMPEPTYRLVCGGDTGHAEAVRVEYDPSIVSYRDLLEAFWNMHDPTQVNRQGPDVGPQYRSVVFYHNDEQRRLAEESKKNLQESGRFRRPIATRLEPVDNFWPAEEYHQQYFRKNRLSRH
jgi:peptide-methionine (S)-S-oxide reductase